MSNQAKDRLSFNAFCFYETDEPVLDKNGGVQYVVKRFGFRVSPDTIWCGGLEAIKEWNEPNRDYFYDQLSNPTKENNLLPFDGKPGFQFYITLSPQFDKANLRSSIQKHKEYLISTTLVKAINKKNNQPQINFWVKTAQPLQKISEVYQEVFAEAMKVHEHEESALNEMLKATGNTLES